MNYFEWFSYLSWSVKQANKKKLIYVLYLLPSFEDFIEKQNFCVCFFSLSCLLLIYSFSYFFILLKNAQHISINIYMCACVCVFSSNPMIVIVPYSYISKKKTQKIKWLNKKRVIMDVLEYDREKDMYRCSITNTNIFRWKFCVNFSMQSVDRIFVSYSQKWKNNKYTKNIII